ncbi:hypothetical protein BDY24DRAFT_368620 [Mrakia frigida]|uniref:uncharacterized protein n=1 Tax=Mrakia frigida TaxID=29902 RepID=UPI003FCC18D4
MFDSSLTCRLSLSQLLALSPMSFESGRLNARPCFSSHLLLPSRSYSNINRAPLLSVPDTLAAAALALVTLLFEHIPPSPSTFDFPLAVPRLWSRSFFDLVIRSRIYMSIVYEQPNSQLAPYFSFHLLAVVLNAPLIYTFVSGKVKRDATISTMLFLYIVTAIGTSLMFMSGTLRTMPPDQVSNVCVVNAAMTLSGIPALVISATLVVVRVLFRVVAAKGRFSQFSDSRALTLILLLTPWVVYFSFLTAGLIVGFSHREKVYVAIFYCAYDDVPLVTWNTLWTLCGNCVTIALEVGTGGLLIRHYLEVRKYNVQRPSGTSNVTNLRKNGRKSLSVGGVSVALASRLAGFGMCVLLGVITTLTPPSPFHLQCIGSATLLGHLFSASIVGDIVTVVLGPIAFLVFASQADVLRCWHILPARRTQHGSTSGAIASSYPATQSRDVVPSDYPLQELRINPDDDRESLADGEERWGSQVALRKKGDDDSSGNPKGDVL